MPSNVFITREYPDYLVLSNFQKVKSKNLGEKFALLNSFFFDYLKEFHISVGYIKSIEKNALKFFNHQQYPFFVKILNIVDEKNAKLFFKKEGTVLDIPIFELYYMNDYATAISESHLISFNLCSVEEIKAINRLCSKVNAVLKSFFERRNLLMAEVSCYFGKRNNRVILIDDFTPKSLKIVSLDPEQNLEPYDINSSEKIKKYTDSLINILSS